MGLFHTPFVEEEVRNSSRIAPDLYIFSPSACLEQRGGTKCLCYANGCLEEMEIWAPTGDGNEGLIQHLPFLSVCFFHWGGQVFRALPHWKQNYAPQA